MTRALVVAYAVAMAVGVGSTGAEAQTCAGTQVNVNSLAPNPINFGTATDPQLLGPPGYVDLTVTVRTNRQTGTVKLCARSSAANMGNSTPPGYTKPLTDLKAGTAGAPIVMTQAYQYLMQQTVNNARATFTVTVRVMLSYAHDWPGTYNAASLQFAAWR